MYYLHRFYYIIMKKIKNYNPDLGLTLNDLRMLMVLYDEDDYNLVADIVDAVIQSVEEGTTFTFPYNPKQVVYDVLMEKVAPTVEDYERQLLEQGYTQEDIVEYHRAKREANNG